MRPYKHKLNDFFFATESTLFTIMERKYLLKKLLRTLVCIFYVYVPCVCTVEFDILLWFLKVFLNISSCIDKKNYIGL